MYSIITFRDIGLTNITVYHGRAYTVVKVTSKPMENGKFGRVRTLKPMNQMTQNLTHLITSAISPKHRILEYR